MHSAAYLSSPMIKEISPNLWDSVVTHLMISQEPIFLFCNNCEPVANCVFSQLMPAVLAKI